MEIPLTGQVRVDFFEAIRLLTNALASSINQPFFRETFGWEERPKNQRLIEFEPMRDEDSFLIQTADIISNFFLNLIKYLIGSKSETVELKAKELLRMNIFDNILDNIRSNFQFKNNKCVCLDDELKVSVPMKSEFAGTRKIIFR